MGVLHFPHADKRYRLVPQLRRLPGERLEGYGDRVGDYIERIYAIVRPIRNAAYRECQHKTRKGGKCGKCRHCRQVLMSDLVFHSVMIEDLESIRGLSVDEVNRAVDMTLDHVAKGLDFWERHGVMVSQKTVQGAL